MDQQWEPVVLRKKAPSGKKKGDVAAAQRSGQVTTSKRLGGGVNRAIGTPNARKIEEETEDFHHRKVTLEFKQALMKARAAKKMTQKQLAQAINEKPSVITDYESGKAVPNPQIIQKLNRALGVALPRIPKKKKTKNEEE